MRHHIFRIGIALLAFTLGIIVTTLWLELRTPKPAASQLLLVVADIKEEGLTKDKHTSFNCITGEPFQIDNDAASINNLALGKGTLNGAMISLPEPSYPAVARAAGASGTVAVAVNLNKKGRITSTYAIAGHPLLRRVAEEAACRARLTPTWLARRPTEQRGILTYRFTLP